MWRKFLQGVFIATICVRIFRFIVLLGLHKTIYKHHPGPCQNIAGIVNGSEDLQLIDDRQIIVSSGLKFFIDLPGRFPNLFLYDVTDPDSEAIALKLTGDLDWVTFNPHGLHVWKDTDTDETYIYVISHRPQESVVEKFLFEDEAKAVRYVITFKDPNFRCLNDLVVLNRDQFYFTNYLFYRPGWFPEDAFQMRWGTVGYYNGEQARIVISGFYRPNGIALSPDKDFLYVAHAGDQSIHIYDRFSDTQLRLIQDYPIYTNPDNLQVDEATGDIIVGCGPVRHRNKKVHKEPNAGHIAPSQVLRLTTNQDKGTILSMEELMMDDGSLISFSTVALVTHDRLVVGSVMGKAVVCQLP